MILGWKVRSGQSNGVKKLYFFARSNKLYWKRVVVKFTWQHWGKMAGDALGEGPMPQTPHSGHCFNITEHYPLNKVHASIISDSQSLTETETAPFQVELLQIFHLIMGRNIIGKSSAQQMCVKMSGTQKEKHCEISLLCIGHMLCNLSTNQTDERSLKVHWVIIQHCVGLKFEYDLRLTCQLRN